MLIYTVPLYILQVVCTIIALRTNLVYAVVMANNNMAEEITLEQEIELVEKAKKDLKAFGDLYDLYFPKLYGFIVYMVGNQTEAEDIVSNAFEKAMLNIEKYEYRGVRFGAWLFRIAKNLVYDRGKVKSTVSIESSFFQIEGSEVTEKEAIQGIEVEDLREFIQGLKPAQREVVVLRYIEGYTIREVAQITGRSEDSIKSACKRGVLELRKKMGKI